MTLWRVGLGLLCATFACRDAAPTPSDAPAASASVAPPVAPTAAPPLPVAPRGFLTPSSFADIARAANPSVVTIQVALKRTLRTVDPFDPRQEVMQGVGSGFFIDAAGTVLTNHHVVTGEGHGPRSETQEVRVTLFDERELSAEIIGVDPPTDLAVLRVKDAAPSVPLAFGDSDAIEVGDWVVAIGNPFGLSHTVSAGIVSGKGRSRDDVPLDPAGYYDFLQTDASINPGNSGGPLLDLQGKVVGINTAIRGGGAQGIGFAVPAAIAKQLVPMLQQHGKVTRSVLGVTARDTRELTAEERTRVGLAPGTRGAVIEYVMPGSGAAAAKLQVGDVVVEFDGQPVERATRLQWLASIAGVGKVVSLKLLRRSAPADALAAPLSVQATLGELDPAKSL